MANHPKSMGSWKFLVSLIVFGLLFQSPIFYCSKKEHSVILYDIHIVCSFATPPAMSKADRGRQILKEKLSTFELFKVLLGKTGCGQVMGDFAVFEGKALLGKTKLVEAILGFKTTN